MRGGDLDGASEGGEGHGDEDVAGRGIEDEGEVAGGKNKGEDRVLQLGFFLTALCTNLPQIARRRIQYLAHTVRDRRTMKRMRRVRVRTW